MIEFKRAKLNALEKMVREELTDGEIVDIYNDYAERNGYDLIYPNDEEVVDMFLSESSPYDILCAGMDYNANDDFICGGVDKTFSCWDDVNSPIDIGDIVEQLQRSDAFSDSPILKEEFFYAMKKEGYDYDSVEEWFDNYLFGNLTEDDWDWLREDYEEWKCDRWFFGEADFETMEKITGFKQADYSPEDGYQDFVDACENWWAEKDFVEKMEIYENFNK